MKYLLVVAMFLVGISLSFAGTNEVSALDSYFSSNVSVIRQKMYSISKDDKDFNLKMGVLSLAVAVQTNIQKESYRANKYLKKYVRKHKEPLILAYLAMSYGLRGRDDPNVAKKILFVNRSIDKFNQTVKMDADNWYIHFLRGNTFFGFPEFFNATKTAVNDFKFVEAYNKKHGLPDGIMVSVYYYRGESEKMAGRIGKAIEYWEKSVQLAKNKHIQSEESIKAQKRIQIFED